MKLGQNNSEAKNALLNGLSETIFTKVAQCKSLNIFGTKFKTFMKEIQNSKKQSFKLTEVNSNKLR
jgi:hypothetical protein